MMLNPLHWIIHWQPVEAGCWEALAATPSAPKGSCGVRFGAANNILVI